MKSLGIFAIMLMLLSSGLIVIKTGFLKHETISKHVVLARKRHIFIYSLAEITMAITYSMFITFWFAPEYNLPPFFTVVTNVGLSGLVLAALVPHKEGIRDRIHYFGSYLMAWAMFLSLLFLPFSDVIADYLNPIIIVSIIGMATLIALGIFAPNRIKSWALYHQIAFFMIYYVSILSVTYFG